MNVFEKDRVVAEFCSIRGGSQRQRGWGEERLRSHGLIELVLGLGPWWLSLGNCLSKRDRLWFLRLLSIPASLVEENFDMFRSPSWVVCRRDSPLANRRVFPDSAEESPRVEVTHFMCIGGVDSVLRRDEESMTTALRIKGSHDAQQNEASLA